MTPEAIKELVRRDIEDVWVKGNVSAVEQVSGQERKARDPIEGTEVGRGPEQLKSVVSHYRDMFSDLQIEIESLIVDGDMAAARLSVRSKATGEFMGVRVDHKPVSITAHNFYRVRDGKIVESWSEWDRLGLMRQLGVFPMQQDRSVGE